MTQWPCSKSTAPTAGPQIPWMLQPSTCWIWNGVSDRYFASNLQANSQVLWLWAKTSSLLTCLLLCEMSIDNNIHSEGVEMKWAQEMTCLIQSTHSINITRVMQWVWARKKCLHRGLWPTTLMFEKKVSAEQPYTKTPLTSVRHGQAVVGLGGHI